MKTRIQSMTWPALLLGLLSTVAACGAEAPVSARTDATAALRSAREVGAEQDPEASYYLELANEQIRVADRLIRSGEMSRAERVLERAEADAEVAMAKTREAATQRQADETMQRIRSMRERYL